MVFALTIELSVYSLGVFSQHTVSPQIDLTSRSHSNLNAIYKRWADNSSGRRIIARMMPAL